jgi:hypothetical protein
MATISRSRLALVREKGANAAAAPHSSRAGSSRIWVGSFRAKKPATIAPRNPPT